MKTLKRHEWLKIGEETFGNDLSDWKFICPKCGLEQSGLDFFRLGLQEDQVEKHLGLSCIGRFNYAETGCDYTIKVFSDNTVTEATQSKPLKIVLENGEKRFVFQFVESVMAFQR